MNNQPQITTEPITAVIQQPLELPQSDIELLSNLSQAITLITDSSQLQIIKNRLEKEQILRLDYAERFELLAELLEEYDDTGSLEKTMNAEQDRLDQLLNEATKTFHEQSKEVRTDLYALKKAYDHGNENLSLFVYQRDRLDQYLDQLDYLLKQTFGKWDFRKASSHMASVKPVDDPVVLDQLVTMCRKYLIMFCHNLPGLRNMDEILAYMENNPLVGTNPKLAFLVTLATRGILPNKYIDYNPENPRNRTPLHIPLAPLMMAQIVRGEVGVNVSGQSGPGLQIAGVVTEYDDEEADADKLDELGIIQVTDNGKIMGTTTANKSSVAAYGEYTSFDVWICVQRSLADVAKKTKFSDWDGAKEEAFRDQLRIYFDSLYDKRMGRRVLAEPVDMDKVSIVYDENNKAISVSILVRYRGIAKSFSFLLKSKKGQLNKVQAKP